MFIKGFVVLISICFVSAGFCVIYERLSVSRGVRIVSIHPRREQLRVERRCVASAMGNGQPQPPRHKSVILRE